MLFWWHAMGHSDVEPGMGIGQSTNSRLPLGGLPAKRGPPWLRTGALLAWVSGATCREAARGVAGFFTRRSGDRILDLDWRSVNFTMQNW